MTTKEFLTELATSALSLLVLAFAGIHQVQLAWQTGQRGHQALAVVLFSIATAIAVHRLRREYAADTARARVTADSCADPAVWRHPSGWTVTLIENPRGAHACVQGPGEISFHFPLPAAGHEHCVIDRTRARRNETAGVSRLALDVAIAYLEHLAQTTPQETHQ